MTFAQSIVLEYESSVPTTRKFIERIPEEKLAWKPAEKSMSIGQLALHIATTSAAVSQFIPMEEVELPSPEFVPPTSVAQLLAAVDGSAATVRAQLWDLSDDYMHGSIHFMAGGVAVMSFTREDTARMILLNHLYHHRGQLGVYLRLLDIPVPASFGPSADEQFNPGA